MANRVDLDNPVADASSPRASLPVTEAHFRAVVDTAKDAIISANSSGTIIYANPSTAELFGYTAAELTGQPLTILMPERFRQAHVAGLHRFLATRESRVLGKRLELMGQKKDGTEFPIELSLTHWATEHDTCFTGIIRDISERRRAENAIRRSDERFRLLVSSVQDYAIFMLDPHGYVSTWNEGARKIKGYRQEEIIGKHVSVFYPSEEVQQGKPQADLRAARRTGRLEDEGWRLRKDGSRFWANAVLTPLFDVEGNLYGFAKVTRDLTERKRMEEELRRSRDELEVRVQERTAELAQLNAELSRSNEELQQFAYIAGHDLQEPLRTVTNFAQLLEHEYQASLDQEALKFLHFIVDGADRMRALIQALLSYARVESQGDTFKNTDCNAVIEGVLKSMEATIAESGAVITRGKMPTVLSDATQLAQIFQNLLANAIKFRGTEPPRLHIEVKERAGAWLFSVEDNGIGIEPPYTSKIFLIFQRLHAKQYAGTGIGLAICKRIVERHGGKIWVESEPGQGSTFFFTIPMRR
jgi:PAS domain S-box-containing protein